ncbi:MAG: acyl-CoA synthetase [Gammaproteobacteria bacterium]|nr:acyl-CoA synthetase [Gammaproteobacteria bacterium]
MYAGTFAQERADKPCFIMANSGEVVTYGEYEQRTNQFAHLLRKHGLQRLDHYAIYMENNARYLEVCGGGDRAGLYYTCVNSYLTAEETAFIINDSQSELVVTSRARREVIIEAMKLCPRVKLWLMVDRAPDDSVFVDYTSALEAYPATPIPDEALGVAMLYSSGTTGRPKGILRPLPAVPPSTWLPLFHFVNTLWKYHGEMIYLSPAPLYHSAPQAAVGLTIRNGGTAVIMEKFDPEQYLALIAKYKITHTQLVPTMFSRMLKLPPDVRALHDVSSLEYVVHAAAPCPVPVKQDMIEWWGPIVHEYYGATEGLGFTACDSAEWLAHPGTVGRVLLGELHILDEEGKTCPVGEPGTVWFKTATPFEYYNDPQKTQEARSADGSMSTVGDVGYVDADGFLYLTDRKTYMIISGGVNIYPQECENLLITHPQVADAAVFGVPNEDLGEEVKAVVQLMPGIATSPALEAELIAFCQHHLARQKCPRSIDFEAELPRLPTGKLYKRVLRDRYWGDKKSRIV